MNGLDSSAAADSTGPNISLYMNGRNFRNGDMVNQNPKLIADLFDENGINLTGTIGHKIEVILNNNENNKIDVTQFYNTLEGYQRGTLEFPLQNLPNGNHTLKLRAWDTYNNSSISSIDFTVKGTSELALDRIFNFPNPMKDFTSFTFNHNFDSPLNINIKIYAASGRLIKDITRENVLDKFVKIDWNGKDSDNDNIANGTYIYKLLVKTQDGKYSKTDYGKLAVLK